VSGGSVVLYGVGSPVVVDVEESMLRGGIKVAAAVHNVDGKAWVLNRTCLVERAALPPDLPTFPFLVPLFTPGNRQRASAEAFAAGFTRAYTLIDPTSVTPSAWVLGHGIYINSGCTIGAATRVGDFVFINRGACIGHHVVLERFVSVGPGVLLGGQVTVGKGALVGAGAVVLPGVSVGENAVVGAGAVVTRDVPDHTLVVGSPARAVKTGIPGHNDLTVE
jgi:sugar O-acyltransferase (sialic acid O-acetyltransferase NeuD family)